MDDLKTLAEIWNEADRKPVEVSCHDSESRYITLVGINHHKAFDSNCFHYPANERSWKLHKPKKLVAHYKAIVQHNCSKHPIVTGTIYPTLEDAECDYQGSRYKILRLATELPPIMLEVNDE